MHDGSTTRPPEASAANQRKALIWLSGTQLLAAIAFLLPTFFLVAQLVRSPEPAFYFLAERSWYQPLPASYDFLLLVLTLLGVPLTLFSAAYAWRLYGQGEFKHASLISAVPLLYLGFSSCLLPYMVMLFLILRG